MKPCTCRQRHPRKRVVLTGGPGAGKTAVLELIRLFFCEHVRTLPESAGIVFSGGFPRGPQLDVRQAAQRAIYHVQHELESTEDDDNAAIVLCDRGTIDGSAYWPGPGPLWPAVGTTIKAELARYDAAIHLRTPTAPEDYAGQSSVRIESVEEAAVIDARIAEAWSSHPRRFMVEATPDFLTKAAEAMQLLRNEVPECCRREVRQFLWHDGVSAPPGP